MFRVFQPSDAAVEALAMKMGHGSVPDVPKDPHLLGVPYGNHRKSERSASFPRVNGGAVARVNGSSSSFLSHGYVVPEMKHVMYWCGNAELVGQGGRLGRGGWNLSTSYAGGDDVSWGGMSRGRHSEFRSHG